MALASYITSPLDPPELILFRNDLEGFSPDYFIIIAKVGIIFNLLLSARANFAGLRISLLKLIWKNSNITNAESVFVALIILLTAALTGAFYDEILVYIELLGGFCSVIFCFFIPGFIYVINNKYPAKSLINIITVFILMIFVIIGYSSGILAIVFKIIKING